MSADIQMNHGHVCRDSVPGLSPKGHSVWVVGWCRSLSSSTSLRPFAPPELPGFVATMDALTPERRLFLPVGSLSGIRHMNTVLSAQVSLLHVLNLLVIPSPTTCCVPGAWLGFLSEAYRVARSLNRPHPAKDFQRLGLRHYVAGSPRQPAESSSSSSYGLTFHLPLLPTPPHGDAVTFSYSVQAEH
jgi:hypothetical protein